MSKAKATLPTKIGLAAGGEQDGYSPPACSGWPVMILCTHCRFWRPCGRRARQNRNPCCTKRRLLGLCPASEGELTSVDWKCECWGSCGARTEATQPKSKKGGMSTTYKRESVEKELVDLRLCPALALWGTKTRRTAEGRLPEIP